MKTYNIRVRPESVGYYKVKAESLDDAEAMAQNVYLMNEKESPSSTLKSMMSEEFEAHNKNSSNGTRANDCKSTCLSLYRSCCWRA